MGFLYFYSLVNTVLTHFFSGNSHIKSVTRTSKINGASGRLQAKYWGMYSSGDGCLDGYVGRGWCWKAPVLWPAAESSL